MPKLTQRLGRLEKALHELGGGGTCRLCYGDLIAVVHVMHEPDPYGPGFRETGDCYLAMENDSITDDLRCRECGAEADQLQVMTIVGIGPKPEGRRVCAV
jgi:hypothetical protein